MFAPNALSFASFADALRRYDCAAIASSSGERVWRRIWYWPFSNRKYFVDVHLASPSRLSTLNVFKTAILAVITDKRSKVELQPFVQFELRFLSVSSLGPTHSHLFDRERST